MKRRHLILSLAALLLFSCKEKKEADISEKEDTPVSFVTQKEDKDVSLDPASYVSWFRSSAHGLRRKKTINDIVYSLQFKSPEYVALIESNKDAVSGEKVRRRAGELQGLSYFDFVISLKEGSGELLKYNLASADEYQNRVKYMSFDMQKDVKLVQGKDTIPCGLYHFERIYDIAPYSNYLLAFDSKRIDPSKELVFVFDDKVFHNGLVKFTFSPNKLVYLPKLRTT
jgi:hypothetical protein